MIEKAEGPRIILNDDATGLIPANVEAPIGVDGFVATAIEPLIGTAVDTVCWTLGTAAGWAYRRPVFASYNLFCHNTRVGERFVERDGGLPSASAWRTQENARQLIAEGNDPPKVVIEHGHKAGKKVFLTFRMNDCHDGLPGNEDVMCAFKREHPEYLLGEWPPHHTFLRAALDYGFAEVRSRQMGLIEEACDNYDLDGLFLDFLRHPRFFKAEQAYDQRHLMTELIRDVHGHLARRGKERGRLIPLCVRVPPTFELASKIGLDVEAWLAEGLVEMLVGSSTQNCRLELPLEEFVKAARGTRCRVYACLSPWVAWCMVDPLPDYKYVSPEMFRAAALRYWEAGVDGIFLFNITNLPHLDPEIPEYRPWTDVAPENIARADKHYVVDHAGAEAPSWASYGETVVPPAQLPLTLGDTAEGGAGEITFGIGDDLESARRDGVLSETTLRIRIVNLTDRDEIEISLNRTRIPPEAWDARVWYDYCWLTAKGAPVVQGRNTLGISVKGRNPGISGDLVLLDVEVLIRYRSEQG